MTLPAGASRRRSANALGAVASGDYFLYRFHVLLDHDLRLKEVVQLDVDVSSLGEA